MPEYQDQFATENWDEDVNPLDDETLPAPPSGLRPILFVPSRRAADPALKAAIEKLIADLEGIESRLGLRQRQRRPADHAAFRLAIEALACNALVVALYDYDQLLAVPRANGSMWGSAGPREPVYGQHFIDTLKLFALPEVGLTEDFARGYSFAGSKGVLSTIRVLPRLREVLGAGSYGWHSLYRDETACEVLLLRDVKAKAATVNGGRRKPKAEAVAFSENAQTKALRDEVRSLNAWLATAPVVVAEGEDGPLRNREDQPVDPTDRSLRRIFNNASWHEGGRLFGGVWQAMRRKDRPHHLLIATDSYPDGEPTVSVDYGQLFARLAYHKAQAAFPDGDLYDAFERGFASGHDQRLIRAGIKRVFNALLFSLGELRQWPDETAKLFPSGTKFVAVRDAIYKKHPALRDLFGTGVGYRLMFTESQILIAVLKDLQRQGIYALPIHDAVIVAHSDRAAAETAMTTGIRQTMGMDLGVKIEAFEPADA